MEKLGSFLISSIGRKFIMALTGAALVLFVIAHMLGNLGFFCGPDTINGYAKLLKDNALVLWGARAGLLIVFVTHILTAITLKTRNRTARPQGYEYQATVQASLSSLTMVFTGILVLSFVVFHLSHFTLGLTHPEHFSLVDEQGRHDVYRMIKLGFAQPLVAWGYVAAMMVLALHLNHGFASLFQTLGVASPARRAMLKTVGAVITGILFVGFSAIPISVQLGLV